MRRPVFIGLLILIVISPLPAMALSCIGYVSQHFELKLLGVVDQNKQRVPALEKLIPFDRLRSHQNRYRGRRIASLVLGYHHRTPLARRGTSVKGFAIDKKHRLSKWVALAVSGFAARRSETLCGFWIRHLPLIPGLYRFVFDGRARQKTPKDIASPTLDFSADRKSVTLAFAIGGKRYVARYRVVRDRTQVIRPLTHKMRKLGMCLRGFRSFCKKKSAANP